MERYLFLVSTREWDGDREYWRQRNPLTAKSLDDVARRLNVPMADLRLDGKSQYTKFPKEGK